LRQRSQRRRCAAFISATIVAVGLVPLAAAPVAAATAALPPVRHVWVLEIENTEYNGWLGIPGGTSSHPLPYLTQTLPSEGAVIPYYFGVGHNSLDNYIAEVSGQAPNPQTQLDCGHYTVMQTTTVDPHGQVVGQGCEYPATAPTLGDQMSAAGLSWKGYMQDMGQNLAGDGATACGHPSTHQSTDGGPNAQNDDGSSNYAVKHNPFSYFDSMVDHDAECRQHVVPLDPNLSQDLASVATTPNFSLIVPTVTWDGHDSTDAMEAFPRKYVNMIMASPAFRQDGMLVVVPDEGSGRDGSACCNEIPGPNSPTPGAGGTAGTPGASSAGGGQIGAVVLSPFTRPGSVVMPSGTAPQEPNADGTSSGTGPACVPTMCTGPGFYNHYSLLRTIEDLFNLGSVPGVPSSDGRGHLGFAGTYADYGGPGEFGCEVFTAYPNCGAALRSPTTDAEPIDQLGPRPLSVADVAGWSSPAVGANDLRAISCPTSSVCVAVGATGTIVASADSGQSWTSIPSGTATTLNGIACPSATACLAVGDAGALITLAAGAAGWTASVSSLPTGGDLNGISCLDVTKCVAVGNNTIASTTDAGATWSAPSSLALPPLSPGSTNDLLGVSCATTASPAATACYAVGSLLNTLPATGATAAPSSENVYRSTNPFVGKTATWTAQQALDAGNNNNGAEPNGSVRLRAITCTDATHCIATGESRALATTVDGNTWNDESGVVPGHNSPLGGQSSNVELYNAISCPLTGSPIECVAVGNRPTYGNTGSMSLAGYSAVQASALVASLGVPGTPTTGTAAPYCTGNPTSSCNTAILERSSTFDTLNAVTCPLAGECIAVGDRGTIVRTSTAFPSPSSTAWTANGHDSSVTWDPPVGGNVDAPFYGISCATLTDCAAVGGGSPDLAEPEAVFAATGPSPWVQTAVPAPPLFAAQVGTASPSPPPTDLGARLAAVSCPAAGQCVAVGTTGWIATLANGAWTSQHVNPTGQTAIPAQPSGQPVRNVVPTEDLQAVSCAPAAALAGDTCAAVGDRGAVLISTDGGATWAVTGNGSSPFIPGSLEGVACPGAGLCVVVGAAGKALALTNSAGIWTASAIPTSTTQFLSAVACPSTTACVVVGAGGAVLTLAHGLGGWSAATHSSGVGDDLYGVACASTTSCAAAGANGTVISTVNSGAAWTAMGTGTDTVFRSVSCPSITTCYEAGDSGAVLSTTMPVPGTLAATLSLDSAQLSTDGATTTATVMVTKNGAADAHATVTLSRGGSGAIGAVVNNNDGTYTATLTASPRVGTETITAHVVDGSLSAAATASLADTVGVPAAITLVVDPARIQADGVSTTTAVATVTDVHQNVVPGEALEFTSDGDVSPSPASATTAASGVASTTLTATKTVGTQQIFATDSAHSLSTHQPLTLLATTVAPTNVFAGPADEQAVVGWVSATPADGDTLSDYLVTASPASSTGPVTVPAGTTSTVVPGLTNGTAYTFTVTAEFGSGKTATSAASSPVTPYGEPSVPSPVTAVAGDTTADVTWGASDPNGSPIQGYTVTAGPGGAQIVVPPDATTAHFAGLTNGTSYTFTVTARNAAEPVTSAPSAAVVPKYGTAFRVAAAQTAIIGGQTGTVHGTLVHDGLPLAGARVTIAVRAAGASSYSTLATVATGGSGQWSLPVTPTRNSSYRVTFAGDAANQPAVATTSMLVHAQVHLVSPRNGTTMRSGRITVTATTRYAVAGTKAWLQYRRPNGEWASLVSAPVSSRGTLTLVTSLNRGTRWLRIYLVSTPTNAAASTKPFVLYLT